MTRGRAMETGDDERREMETTERADVRGARFRRRSAREREREREREKEKSSRFRYTACIC